MPSFSASVLVVAVLLVVVIVVCIAVLPRQASLSLRFDVSPTAAVVGQTLSPAVQVSVRDGSGNVVTSNSDSITIDMDPDLDLPPITGTAVKSAVNGIALFNNLALGNPGAFPSRCALRAAFTGQTQNAASSSPFPLTL